MLRCSVARWRETLRRAFETCSCFKGSRRRSFKSQFRFVGSCIVCRCIGGRVSSAICIFFKLCSVLYKAARFGEAVVWNEHCRGFECDVVFPFVRLHRKCASRFLKRAPFFAGRTKRLT